MVTEHRWSTTGVPVEEQRALWEHVAAETWVPVSVSRGRHRRGCHSAVSGRRVADLTVAGIATCPQVVRRLESQVSANPGDKFFLNLPLVGGTTASQGGRRAGLRPGDFALVDSAAPFELAFMDPLRQLSLTIPHETLLPRLRQPGPAMAVRIDGSRGVGAVAAGAIRGLADVRGPVDRHTARELSRHVVELIALALGAATPVHMSPDLLRQAALDEVERSLGDPELTPAIVADRLGVSVRYLHKLFSDHGPSFGRWLLQQRLARCHDALTDPLRPPTPIGDLARAHGFRDPSYFTRAYRARYDHSPSEARRRRR